MKLKDYQQKALDQVKRYLQSLDGEREKDRKSRAADLGSRDWPAEGWKNLQLTRSYNSRQNGLGEELPNFVLKIPTGGGKTLLAVKAIDLINEHLTKRRTGLVTWIVPTTQIYQQTLQALRNRDHPYRQHLDLATAGRTIVVEKQDRFTPGDVAENLVVLLLMLPSANRKNKDVLRFFRDNGGFDTFFPSEEQYGEHEALLEQVPNLDIFGDDPRQRPLQIKTSLGNVLRILRPIVILDESHKGKSPIARDTLEHLNPSIVVELSATPSDDSNVLVDIKGKELEREDMLKLDVHVVSKASTKWEDSLLAAIEKRNLLEEATREYEARTGVYIRPIALIQVERTGKEQRESRFIHAEDVRDYLVKTAGIPQDQIKVQTSETKELEADPEELLSKRSQTRYIITKSALQEGWDCAFAYVLAILTNPQSKNGLTQLVGRILRQPLARKTGVQALDESYVFAYRQETSQLLAGITRGFEIEGLEDLAHAIVSDETIEQGAIQHEPRIATVREHFQRFADRIFLPVFVTERAGHWQRVSYEMDILPRIDWSQVNVSAVSQLTLSKHVGGSFAVAVGLGHSRLEEHIKEGGLELDEVFVARHLLDVVDNPWLAFEFANSIVRALLERYDRPTVTTNVTLIVESLRNQLEHERDRLASQIFQSLLGDGKIRFLILRDKQGEKLPSKITYPNPEPKLRRPDDEDLQLSLLDYVPVSDFNELEKQVAWYLEDQAQLFWWYRNRARHDYELQGWKRGKVYADFLFSLKDERGADGFSKIFVVETKGVHLKNEDTAYKQELFDLCNEQAKRMSWTELGLDLPEKQLRFEVVFEDEWRAKLNQLMAAA